MDNVAMACRVEIVAKTPLPRDNGVKRIRRFAGTAVVAAGAFICCPSSALAAVHLPGRMQTTAFVPGLSMLSFRSETLGSSGVSCRPKMAGLRAAGMALAKETDKAAREGGVKVSKATDYYKPLVEGDILESTDTQRAIVVFSYGILALLGMKAAVMLSAGEGSVIGFLIAALVGFEFADFGSGVYHWSMDNYGNKDTPVFGTQIVAFQGHHELPWTITYRQVCNNIYKICQATAPFALGGLLLIDNPYILIWMTTAIAFINMSQELHKWSHMSPSQAPALVNTLQEANIIIGRKAHLAHHKPPFDGNYCIVSGHCNPLLDQVGFFRWMEKFVHSINKVEARCWNNERLLQHKVESLGIKRSTTTISR